MNTHEVQCTLFIAFFIFLNFFRGWGGGGVQFYVMDLGCCLMIHMWNSGNNFPPQI